MANAQGQLVSTLNHLIEVGKDGELSCMTGAREVHNPEIRAILTGTAETCRASVLELKALVSALGAEPRDRGSMGGSLHRGWMEVLHMIAPHNDDAVLQLCERDEETARREYQSALTKEMPADVRAVVQRQYEGIQWHHDRIHAMRGMQIH
ncbi:PA2169 family four-helix-bundle protein [Cupriavidus basilensis]|uniref:PA2169 family four-helix-bundle protein n=1 Tax=Cupriavidus basilensis TaxID=68895 RepID=A0ABT6AKF5_9BURK|nr:PA2169 family four-helix-bundle protein [Cupriavidus basilensis]MDF3832903.1 PA2169 family four-helix-bundle protein [Cupriavidus basilensis]